jgi:Ca2+-binding RTX toxin-like protein
VATVKFSIKIDSFNISSDDLFESNYIKSTSSKTLILEGGNDGEYQVYKGKFFYDRNGEIDGKRSVINSFEQRTSRKSLQWSVSGLKLSVNKYLDFYDVPDSLGLVKYILSGNDVITGSKFNDVLAGRGGADKLTGGKGKDIFAYSSIADSRVGGKLRDTITDFEGNSGEKINLSAIDAYTRVKGNQAFTYIQSKKFTGQRGEVRFSGGVLQMNTGTDKIADMEIALTGVTSFSQNFLVL